MFEWTYPSTLSRTIWWKSISKNKKQPLEVVTSLAKRGTRKMVTTGVTLKNVEFFASMIVPFRGKEDRREIFQKTC